MGRAWECHAVLTSSASCWARASKRFKSADMHHAVFLDASRRRRRIVTPSFRQGARWPQGPWLYEALGPCAQIVSMLVRVCAQSGIAKWARCKHATAGAHSDKIKATSTIRGGSFQNMRPNGYRRPIREKSDFGRFGGQKEGASKGGMWKGPHAADQSVAGLLTSSPPDVQEAARLRHAEEIERQ